MEKIAKKTGILFLALIIISGGIAGFGNSAQACSIMEGSQFPTIESVREDGASVFIAKTLSSGTSVVGLVVETFEGETEDYVALVTSNNSCGDRFHIDANKYALVITPEDESFVIQHDSIDNQFAFYYSTQAAAEENADRVMNGEDPVIENEDHYAGFEYVPAGYTLRPGMKNNDVRNLQQALDRIAREADRSVAIDGSYGPATTQAVKNFQASHNLPVDGIAGPKTQNMIRGYFIEVFNA